MLETIFAIAMLLPVQAIGEGIQCDFPGSEPGHKNIVVRLSPHPSLKDQPGLFRVMMDLDGKLSLKGAAQPISTTDERDVLVLGKSSQSTVYTLGLRDDGSAALSMRRVGSQTASTRIGHCRGHETHIERWIPE